LNVALDALWYLVVFCHLVTVWFVTLAVKIGDGRS